MAKQTELDGSLAGIQEAHIYYRRVQSEQRRVDPETQTIDSPSELEEIEKLLSYIKTRKLRYPVPLVESDMNELPSDRTRRILSAGPDERDVADLLSLFCDSLEGRQKAENKYAMLIYVGDSFLLAHVRAERGMSLKEEDGRIELIRRFLDVDNILSAALFENHDGDVRFSHFTDTGSDSFRNFLGVRKRQYHYEKKNVQIVCYYEGKKGLEVKFEFSNDEFDDLWLNDDKVKLSGSKFTLNGGRSHQVKEIRWGNQTYDSITRFQSEFKEQSFSLEGERKRYERLLEHPSGSEISVFGADDAIDYRHHVELIRGNSSETVDKGSLPDNFHVVYANSNVGLDSGFADDIIQDIINDLDISIYHPSEAAAAQEFRVNNITFLNIDRNELTSEIADFVTKAHDHAINRTGEQVSRCLVTLMLHVLAREVEPSFENAITQIININTGNPRNQAVVSTKENEGPGLIEYKNKQDLEKSDPAEVIVGHIKTEKSKKFDTKVFLWGVTEQSREIDGLSTQSWNDDRVAGIESTVADRLNSEGITHNDFIMQPIPLGANGDRWVIAGILY